MKSTLTRFCMREKEWIKNCLLTPSIISMLTIYRQSILIKIVGTCAIYNLMHYAQFP